MTTKTGKPRGLDQPVTVDGGNPVLGEKEPNIVMHSNLGNGEITQPGTAVIGADIQGHLGRKLKASYDELVRQPVPNKFRELLEELERKEKKQ